MLKTIEAVNSAVNNFIWGIPAMVCIIGVGLYLSFRTGFIQIRKFPYSIKNTLGRIFDKSEAADGSITPFQAVCTALAGTVGTGNIAGVAGAITIGGPGAVFWMWIITLIGAASAYTESALGQAYKVKNPDGEYMGGPAYHIEKGLKCKPYAILFAMVAFLGPGFLMPGVQINSLVTVFE